MKNTIFIALWIVLIVSTGCGSSDLESEACQSIEQTENIALINYKITIMNQNLETYPDTEKNLLVLEDSILQAIESWNAALGMDLFSYGFDDRGAAITFIVAPIDNNFLQDVGYDQLENHSVQYGGFAKVNKSSRRCAIQMDSDRFDEIELSTYIHEIAHCLSLSHNTDPNSIMYCGGSSGRELSEEDTERALENILGHLEN